MKKFAVTLLIMAVIFGSLISSYLFSREEFPANGIYNYFEQSKGGILMQNLDDYVAAQSVDTVFVYDKRTSEFYPLTDSVFDLTKNSLHMISAFGNTLYYVCADNRTKCFTCYAFNLQTYEKTKIYTDNAVTDTAGFLGMESIFGIQLRTTDFFTLVNLGKYWGNESGIHDPIERTDFLSEFDEDDQFGLFDGMDQFSETDSEIYFINYFGELVRFDKEKKTFDIIIDRPVSDFFVTENKLYYISSERTPILYASDHNGANAESLGANIIPTCVRLSDGRIFVSDRDNVIYDMTDGTFTEVGKVAATSWTADNHSIYTYNADTEMITATEYDVSE